jgi:hypothetical protein
MTRQRTRPLPDRKTDGTRYNLRPATERVRADSLRPGNVVIENADHPALITKTTDNGGRVTLRARYIWSATTEPDWPLGTFHPAALLDRAMKGEY